MQIKTFFFLAVFLLCGVLSLNNVHAQTTACPSGYTCTPVSQSTINNTVSTDTNMQGINCFTFKINLGVGDTGNDVIALRVILNRDSNALGSYPFDDSVSDTYSNYFDDALATAVSNFQDGNYTDILEPNGLTTGTGYVGSATRAKLNQLYGCSTSKVTSLTDNQKDSFKSELLSIYNLLNGGIGIYNQAMKNNDYATALSLYSQAQSDFKMASDQLDRLESSANNNPQGLKSLGLDNDMENATANLNYAVSNYNSAASSMIQGLGNPNYNLYLKQANQSTANATGNINFFISYIAQQTTFCPTNAIMVSGSTNCVCNAGTIYKNYQCTVIK